jgi:NTP pyrophosphatase (non-canonical NTP hydrolase)
MEINNFIKDLSVKDKKSLSQKGLKLSEEVGELAKAILPFDSAHGTSHRFSDREKILDGVIDVYLANISIAYSLDFSDEEIENMLIKKSKKWSELQSKEEKSSFPLPFEIHITIDSSMDNFELDNFEYDCRESIGVKPIVLDLEVNGLATIKDLMTSSKHFGNNRSAYDESLRIVNELKFLGYTVLRSKIESVPWHPAAPVNDNDPMPENCYFESHIGVVISPEEKNDLTDFVNNTLTIGNIIRLNGTAKLSQNFFKKSINGGKFVNMLTYRSYVGGYETFKREVDCIKTLLNENLFEFEKVEVEFALYDTNISHDVKWIG